MNKIKMTQSADESDKAPTPSSAWERRLGWALSSLFALFMGGASILPKFLQLDGARNAMDVIGWPADAIPWIGALELACLVLYLWRRTDLLGAIVMTGLLGGAMAAQFRVGAPLLTHSLFGLYLGLAMWGGLWLRDPSIRRILPWRSA